MKDGQAQILHADETLETIPAANLKTESKHRFSATFRELIKNKCNYRVEFVAYRWASSLIDKIKTNHGTLIRIVSANI